MPVSDRLAQAKGGRPAVDHDRCEEVGQQRQDAGCRRRHALVGHSS